MSLIAEPILGAATKARVTVQYPIKPVATVRRGLTIWTPKSAGPGLRLAPFFPMRPTDGDSRQVRHALERWAVKQATRPGLNQKVA